jgi:hypothetical protein
VNLEKLRRLLLDAGHLKICRGLLGNDFLRHRGGQCGGDERKQPKE